MAKKRIYELLNKAVLTVTDLFMIDKSGDVNATNVSGQQIVDLVDANIVRVETVSGTAVDNTDPLNPVIDNPSLAFTDLTDVPTDYTGEGGKYVMVALTEDGLVFNTVSSVDTNIYNTNGTLTGNRTVTGGGFSLTFNNTGNFQINSNVTDWNFGFRDVVGGYPSFVLQSPVNAFTDTRHIVNNAVVYRQYTGFNDFVQQIKNYQISDILSGRTQVIKNTLGEWLFTQDVTGLQTPEAGVRAKFYGTVKTVSPSSSPLDTAFSVRNNVDNADHFLVKGNGDAIFINSENGVKFYPKDNLASSNAIEVRRADDGVSFFRVTGEGKTHSLFTCSSVYNDFNNSVTLFRYNDESLTEIDMLRHVIFFSKVSMRNVQIGNAGLVAGDLYFDTAANILANGDLVCGRKV